MNFFLRCIALLVLSGCSTVEVGPLPALPAITRLAELRAVPLHLIIKDNRNSRRAGTQFMFVIIPFGNIGVRDARNLMFPTIFRELTLLGFRPTNDVTAEPVEIRVHKIGVSAYDFLLARRVTCSVEGVLSLSIGNFPFAVYHGEFRKFGFQSDLEQVMEQCSTSLAGEIAAPLRHLPIIRRRS